MGNREMSFSVVLEPKPKVPSLARGECEACGRWVGDLMSKKGRIQWIQEWAKKRPVSVMPEPEAPLPLQPLLLLWTASPSSCSTAILNTNAQSLSSCAVPQLLIGIKGACKQRFCWPSRHLFKKFTCHAGFISYRESRQVGQTIFHTTRNLLIGQIVTLMTGTSNRRVHVTSKRQNSSYFQSAEKSA